MPTSTGETVFQTAVDHWWKSKDKNANEIKKPQGGSRDACVRGDTMDGFRDIIVKALIDLGVDPDDIYCGAQVSRLASNLPSYYRATKNWDVVVCKNAHHKRLLDPTREQPKLIAVIEFKSQNESIGKNQNNRLEESIGNAHDFWASYENKSFLRLTPKPWLGYLFVGKYAEGAEHVGVEINQPIIPTDSIFDNNSPRVAGTTTKFTGVSYADRYHIFLERMLGKKLYDGACFIVTDETIAGKTPNYRILYPDLSGLVFMDNLLRYVNAYYF